MSINILIPMAGAGSRFKKEGFKNIKPLIEVSGKTFIEWSVSTLDIEGNYIFVVQQQHLEQVKPELKRIKPNCQIFTVPELTRGAVETCLSAKDAINNDDPLIITNSDQTLWWDSKLYLQHLKKNDPDGDVVICEANTDKFSYIKLDENGFGTQLAEKEVISNNALVGVHYFKHGKDFVYSGEKLISKNIRSNNEFYVSLAYNMLIEDKKKITAYKLPNNDEYLTIGTPEQLYDFMNKKNLNLKKYKMSDMFRGWFIGNFDPSVYKTDQFEVGYLIHKKGEKWDFHYHAKSTEINYLIRGKMLLNGQIINPGEIFVFDPKVIAVPNFLEDCEIICVKVPSAPGDKIVV
tara:strand:+ start:2296 stop:3339 length:1044 start_codon:yes stop_codon:yes gene_type:complete